MGTPTHHRLAPVVVRKATADTHALSVTAVLTFPGRDQAGDIVHPDGLDFATHRRSPWVDLEHNGQCVGWARKSLSAAGGLYGLEYLDLEHGGQTHRLPVGTTWFDPNDALQSQVFRLVAEDALPGVSLEFRPIPRQFKAIGRSPIERRPAMEFFKGDVIRWTHCASPVNEGATVAKSMSATGTDRLLTALSAKRVGSEPMHPTIFKSLSQYLPQRRLVRVEKSMDPNDAAPTAYDDAAPEAPEAPAEEGGNPTAQAANNIAQGLKDLAAQGRADIAKGEHKKGRQKLSQLCDDLDAMVEEALAVGQMVDKDLNGGDTTEPDGDEGEEPTEAPDSDADDEGIVKGIPTVYRKALKRFTLKQITKARESSQSDDANDSEAQRELRKLGRALRRSGI